jgi:hypothetical protein
VSAQLPLKKVYMQDGDQSYSLYERDAMNDGSSTRGDPRHFVRYMSARENDRRSRWVYLSSIVPCNVLVLKPRDMPTNIYEVFGIGANAPYDF